MNNVFLCLINKGKNLAKYFIFSFIFVLSCFLGVDAVNAANELLTDTTRNSYTPNDSITGITTIDGTLVDSCVAPATNDYLPYTINGASHNPLTGETWSKCVSYKTSTEQYFYLQASDAASNKIKFIVSNVPALYNYVVVLEPNYSLADTSTYDYDIYTLNGTSYTAGRKSHNSASVTGSASATGSASSYTYTFEYELRNDAFGHHNAYVYFYTAEPQVNNETKKTQLSYTLAKPISEYTFDDNKDISTDNASYCSITTDVICIDYTSKPNTGSVVDQHITNDFTIRFNDNAALYFSTINTHTTATETIANIKKYNSLYATNTFSNYAADDAVNSDSVVYYYFNAKDSTAGYEYAVTTATTGYTFKLTIDASGKYRFFLEDIFGNELVKDTFSIDITDVSNRDLTIFYIAYSSANVVGNAGTNKDTDLVEDFELKDDLSKLTIDNVTIGLEFYFKVKINDDRGTPTTTDDIIYAVNSSGTILNNPLYEEQIRMRDTGEGTPARTYYCRQKQHDNQECVAVPADLTETAINESNFHQQVLTGTQTIEANATTGLKGITTTFTYKPGLLSTYDEYKDIISKTVKENKVDFVVNENGRFFVRVQDIYGNHEESSIDVSIVDQLKPIVTVNGTSSLTNYICSSMYVIGAGGTIQTYPTAKLESVDCGSGNKVSYDHFKEVDTSNGTEKRDTITVQVKRPVNTDAEYVKTSTNGFYNLDTNEVSFDYADAIRIALLRVSDSVTIYGGTTFEKSIYEKTEADYTSYGLYSLKNDGGRTDTILGSNYDTGRQNYMNDFIIQNNYLQYSSELNSYDSGTQFVNFSVYAIDAGDNDVAGLVCSSVTNGTDCYDIVNRYIDKSISFKMVFVATDFVGNESLPITVKVDVVDDTTPGITNIDSTTSEVKTDPIIAANNIDTNCRLEIGSIVQTKAQLLECYGLTTGNTKYNFVDNATTYSLIQVGTAGYKDTNYYKNVLHQQLYDDYDDYVKVYVCQVKRLDTDTGSKCGGSGQPEWKEVLATTDLKFANAGNYEIKFVITDTKGDYQETPDITNTTTIIMCYYVNPRVLLVRPIETEKVYGKVDPTIEYCVYATKNTNAFYSNLFNNSDTYQFVLDNYESSTHGMVYCTSNTVTDDTNATTITLLQLLVNEGAEIQGSLYRTYATGTNSLKMELTADAAGHKPYEDAGYYYITMGDLKINAAHKDNYILRLHPSYLLDGQIPNPGLKNYDEVAVEVKDGETTVYANDYKFGGKNTAYKGETVSNVLYTIKQTGLTITANGGNKIYGVTDTNYSQAFNKAADVNISSLTYKNESDATTTVSISTAGYLNGFTVSGLINGSVVNDYNRYTSIIEGYLRRQIGEISGKYYICNVNVSITGNDNTIAKDTSCDYLIADNDFAINTTTGHIIDLTTSNVYTGTYSSGSISYSSVANATDITYGKYVKIGSAYYKLTRNNTDLANKKFTDFSAAKLWQYSYDDSNAAVKVLANELNANQNYYIEYNDGIYTINPSEVIVQPGFNQGKEYSDPEHNDPIFEIIVYGEKLSITSSENTTSKTFNGYTVGVEALDAPATPTKSDYPEKASPAYEGDTDLYFSDRRTKTHDVIDGHTFEYKYDAVDLTADKEFTVDTVVYVYKEDTDKFCAKLNQTSECYDNGSTIGSKTITIASGKVTITLVGILTYQTYELFTSDGTASANGTPGTGYITRTPGKVVGWYDYIFDGDKLFNVGNGNLYCASSTDSTTKIKTYSVTGTGTCVNYNVKYTDNAPAAADANKKYVTSTTGEAYRHDGANYCGNTNIYSYSCGGTVAAPTVKKIKFSIFKRDIILSFNAASETYGQVYSYFANGIFKIADKKSNDTDGFPTVITCYAKATSAQLTNTSIKKFVGKNGKSYVVITDDDCKTADYGLSINDTWGSTGLNLQFFLHNDISGTFTEDYYPIPAGLYFVHASIGTSGSGSGTDGNYVHSNYNLIYIDYDILVTGKDDKTQEDGALKITPKDVTLTGTYYQKEYGQAVYATYDSNGTALTTVTDSTTGVISSSLVNATTIKIFDNHYYYCEKAASATVYNADKENSVYYGCAMTEDPDNGQTNYYYGSTTNVYLYIVNGMVDENGNGNFADEIDVNFVGTPVRTRPSNAIAADGYALLDDVGHYEISLSGIEAVVAQYIKYNSGTGTAYEFKIKDANGLGSTIKRFTNYNITGRTSGLLYITPAQIEIEVTQGQTKMYGCAYNTVNTTENNSAYTYGAGYTNCVETAGQYYDLGYEYTVKGDKYNFLKSTTTEYSAFNACATLADRKTATGCNDKEYDEDDLTYTVTPTYDTNGAHNKADNTALNDGNLFRITKDDVNDDTEYTYLDIYKLSLESQKEPDEAKYQKQIVDDYVITLGTLDAAFNANKHCNSLSMPLSASGDYACKNFIVNYGGNNTSTHVSEDGSYNDYASIPNTTKFKLENETFLFTITTRKVVIATEYNYKVVGDTEPNEGYTCQDLINMHTYLGGDANFSKTVSLTGRSYCSTSAKFIKTGVARYYAIDNSLAKAPWTGWTTSDNNTYTTYNDILFDVIDSTSQIIRVGLPGATAGTYATASSGDPIGKYKYDYQLTLATSYNGSNYEINYLSGNTDAATPTTTETSRGYAKDRPDATGELDRWYDDSNHKCDSNSDATNTKPCAAYSGTQSYNFVINGIAYYNADTTNYSYKKANSYSVTVNSSDVVSSMKDDVYFEIVRREIFIQTQPVNKDYGFEDRYNMFDVKLCSEYDTTNGCTEIAKTNEWGKRNSLSNEDYAKFYPSGTFSQAAFKGSVNTDTDPSYRGETTGTYARAFGIYMYRTYGEVTGTYAIVACATQYANDLTCRNYYAGLANDTARLADIKHFKYDTPTGSDGNNYNASNYIVKTIPSTITINQRKIYITPDSDQGFDYGNFETGYQVSPITFVENYVQTGTTKTATAGLVNGGLFNTDDDVNKQYSLCIYDISERLTCINDRQNSSGGTIDTYITTGLHNSGTSTEIATADLPATTTHLGFNVYNDSYDKDNDDSRFALNRSLSTDTNARYNRNVGTYTITAGEMFSSATGWDPYCSASKTKDCLNVNYKIVGFENGVTYTISPATIIITPESSQSKTYGNNDVELQFVIETYFKYKEQNNDKYYCQFTDSKCQNTASTTEFVNYSSTTSGVVKLLGFAYSEDDKLAGYDGTTIYNYGKTKDGEKTTASEAKASDFANDGANNPKFYDKYCYRSGSVFTDCAKYENGTASHAYASMKYGETARILLGYFYVENWNQKVGTHNILNGISVAKNEFNNVNYLYKASVSDADDVLVAIGQDTNVDFTINKLAVDATIEDITKVYGQATDSHKCDGSSEHVLNTCNEDYAALNADDDEGRLEYNFNVTGTGINAITVGGVSKVILTKAINDQYYTQTGNAEYKNIHLGLTVVRKINNATACISGADKFGCEDVGSYTLAFRKQDVPDTVDENYDVSFGTATSTSIGDATGYAIVVSTTEVIEEKNGLITDSKIDSVLKSSYIVYKSANELDTIPTGQNSSASDGSSTIKLVSGYTATLTINKRNVVFYIGTYNDDGSVAERYVIEENEQVPEFPTINAKFTTTATTVKTKQVYQNTWFDETQYDSSVDVSVNDVTHAPRQVRTSDIMVTTYDGNYGVGVCSTYTDNVQAQYYGSTDCTSIIKYTESNNIVDNKYVFDTALPDGVDTVDYAIVRNPAMTYIVSEENETKNYDTDDYNGVLVIYKDQTAPIIQVGNDNKTFAIEANAHTVNSGCSVTNEAGKSFVYNCSLSGLLFDENNKSLGQIIKYITENYSGYNGATDINNAEGSITDLPRTLDASLTGISVYWPVNNIGIKASNKATTLYDVDRTVNTYDFDTSYITSTDSYAALKAISTIISWFNINSYDYSYIRGSNYQTKRYTPRYYFFIEGNDTLTNFDPTFVGDFNIKIYAIDDVGNQQVEDVTLKIIDTTKPTTSEMHIFNAPVVCSETNCKTNNISSWTVAAGGVPIDAFIKYKYDSATTTYVEDNTNGTYIKLNGSYVNIYGTSISRYLTATATTTNILGNYVKVVAGQTAAVEVEHKYWSNIKEKYLVVVGGMDNSYIDPAATDTNSQWNTYYTIDDGTTWYKYQRHANTSIVINFADGVGQIFTKVMDTGRGVTVTSTTNGYIYYNDVYLRYVASGDACTGIANCEKVDTSETPIITQVSDAPMTTTDSGANYKFKIHSIDANYNVANAQVTWTGQTTPASVNTVDGELQFTFGIMTCTIDTSVAGSYNVDCETEYKLVYNKTTNDKVSKDKHAYTVPDAGNSRNIGDWNTITTPAGFYPDRRYLFIDTAAPTLTLNGDGYGIYEYDNKCAPGVTDDDICSASYDEKFLDASDGINSSNNTSSVIDPTTTSLTELSESTIDITKYIDIILYTGSAYSKVADSSSYTASGLLQNTTLIMSGADYDNTEDAATFNKHYLSLVVYLSLKEANQDPVWYRYLAIFNGEKYYIIKQEYDTDSNKYADIATFNTTNLTTYETIETVLEYIVSTDSVDTSGTSAELTFSINYVIKDAANNASAPVANSTVRGATYIKLTSRIEVDVEAAATPTLLSLGNNTYQVEATQGVSFATLLNGLTISNIDVDGNNNLGSVKQSLYYNGVALFENLSYNDDVLSIVDDYATAPGVYTLRLTSSRNVTGLLGNNYQVEDTPLEINFVVNPNVATIITDADNSMFNVSIILMCVATMFLISLGYVSIKKTRK